LCEDGSKMPSVPGLASAVPAPESEDRAGDDCGCDENLRIDRSYCCWARTSCGSGAPELVFVS
jgi:hypothetical protein